MYDELKEEGIVNKVGGRFKLSTLIQKRLVALNTGARPLIDARHMQDKMAIVIQEILQDKIYLDLGGEVQVRDTGIDEESQRHMFADTSEVAGPTDDD
jgi:DNA-directed RNA polymerase subunit omega